MLASAGAMAQSKDDVRDTVVTDTTVWKSLELEGVVVKSHAVKVKVQGDSLVYNAAAYRVPEGSTLEALVKQLPEEIVRVRGAVPFGRLGDTLLVAVLNPLDAGLRGLVGQLGAMAAPSPAYAAWLKASAAVMRARSP